MMNIATLRTAGAIVIALAMPTAAFAQCHSSPEPIHHKSSQGSNYNVRISNGHGTAHVAPILYPTHTYKISSSVAPAQTQRVRLFPKPTPTHPAIQADYRPPEKIKKPRWKDDKKEIEKPEELHLENEGAKDGLGEAPL